MRASLAAALAAALVGCAQTGVQPDDYSLTSAEYVQRGVPPPDRRWDADDYVQASKVLAALAKENAHRLPRHGSVKSGAVFARIVAPENLAAYRNPSGSLEQRFASAAVLGRRLTPAFAQIMQVYRDATEAGAAGSREFIELSGLVLRALAVQSSLVTEADVRQLAETGRALAREPGLSAERRAAAEGLVAMPERYRRIQTGMAASVIGALRLLEEPQFDDGERIRVAELLRETLPPLAGAMPRIARTEAMLRMDALIGQFAEPTLKALLHRLRDEFGRAAGSAAGSEAGS